MTDALIHRQVTKDAVLDGVVHDLKNPLAIIKASVQLLRRDVLRPFDGIASIDRGTALARLERIDSATVTILRLIEGMLNAGAVEVPTRLDEPRTDLVDVVRHAVDDCRETYDNALIRFTSFVPEALGSWDALGLERVVWNLLTNALKYGLSKPVTVSVSLESGLSERFQSWVLLRVTDQGTGIPATELPTIFERYRRASNVVHLYPGFGIGLATARDIVEQEGGTIKVESSEGVGSSFTVRLPLACVLSEYDIPVTPALTCVA